MTFPAHADALHARSPLHVELKETLHMPPETSLSVSRCVGEGSESVTVMTIPVHADALHARSPLHVETETLHRYAMMTHKRANTPGGEKEERSIGYLARLRQSMRVW